LRVSSHARFCLWGIPPQSKKQIFGPYVPGDSHFLEGFLEGAALDFVEALPWEGSIPPTGAGFGLSPLRPLAGGGALQFVVEYHCE